MDKCLICFEADAQVIAFPCNHHICCCPCFEKARAAKSLTNCFLCREKFTAFIFPDGKEFILEEQDQKTRQEIAETLRKRYHDVREDEVEIFCDQAEYLKRGEEDYKPSQESETEDEEMADEGEEEEDEEEDDEDPVSLQQELRDLQ